MEDLIQTTLAEILQRMGIPFRRFKVSIDPSHADGKPLYRIDIDADDSATLIGHHGENIYALQHVLKTVVWKKANENVFIVLDVDSYRKRQEDTVLNLAKKKVEALRTSGVLQTLPPMSPYFRRVIHLFLAQPEYSDVASESIGEGDHRAVTIKTR